MEVWIPESVVEGWLGFELVVDSFSVSLVVGFGYGGVHGVLYKSVRLVRHDHRENSEKVLEMFLHKRRVAGQMVLFRCRGLPRTSATRLGTHGHHSLSLFRPSEPYKLREDGQRRYSTTYYVPATPSTSILTASTG
jgi:hypothetical protein